MLKQLFGGGKPDHPMADPKEARRILEQLAALDTFKALDELAHWHESVSAAEAFKLEQRAALLIAIDDAAQSRVRKLGRDYFAAERPSRFLENRLWTHVHEYWRQAGLAFARCVDGFMQDAKPSESARAQLPIVVLRALRSLAQQIKWMHLRYGPVDFSVWGVLNKVYALAETRNILDVKVAPYPQTGETTPRHEFLKAAMFSASSPDSLLPHEVELAERLIADLTPGFAFAAGPGGPELAYWMDLTKPLPPQRVGRAPAQGVTLRSFGGGAALVSLQGFIQKIEASGRIPPELNLGAAYEPEAALDVMQHLAMYWSPVPPERRHPRHSVKSRLSVVYGFDSLVEVLGPEDSLSFQRPVEEAWIVENVSAGGFGAAVPQLKGDWLKVGVLLAMQPEGGTNWVLGMIRRVSKISGQQARVGIQTLSKAPRAVQLDMGGVGEVQGILLPSGDAGSVETCIVLRPAVFVAGVNAECQRDGRHYVYIPQGIAERGDDYEIVRFREMIKES
jgi:hypothetical protein